MGIDGVTAKSTGRAASLGKWLFTATLFVLLAVTTTQFTNANFLTSTRDNTRYAYNVKTYGVFGAVPSPKVKPDMMREPLPVFVTLAYMYANPMYWGDFDRERLEDKGDLVYALKFVNLLWVALLFGATYLLARALSAGVMVSLGIAVASWYLLVFSSEVTLTRFEIKYIDTLLTEIPMVALMTLSSYFMLQAYRVRTARWFVFAGLAMAGLALTKAAFYYISFGVMLSFLGVWIVERRVNRRSLMLLLAMFIGFMVPVSAWNLRNVYQYDEFQISAGRGGYVLFYHLRKAEYGAPGMIYAWTPDSLRPVVGYLTGFSEVDLRADGRLSGLNRANKNSIHKTMVQFRKDLQRKARMQFATSVERDGWMRREAIKYALTDPSRYLITTVAFLYRGAWVLDANPASALLGMPELLRDLLGGGSYLLFLLSVPVFLLMRRNDLALVFILPLGMVAFNTLLTHALVRYNYPLTEYFLLLPLAWYVVLAARRSAQARKPAQLEAVAHAQTGRGAPLPARQPA